MAPGGRALLNVLGALELIDVTDGIRDATGARFGPRTHSKA